MVARYYYLIASLPELDLRESHLPWSLGEFKVMVESFLTPEDKRLWQLLFFASDILNAPRVLLGEPAAWREEANYTEEDWLFYVEFPGESDPYFRDVFSIAAENKASESGPALLKLMTASYMRSCFSVSNAFLRRWFNFEFTLRNLMIWLNCHKFKLNPELEILGEYDAASFLRKNKPGEADLSSWDYRYREAVAQYDNPNLALREYIIDEMKWRFLEELEADYSFQVENLLAYAIRIQITERNNKRFEEKGRQKLEAMIEHMRSDAIPNQ
jgi:hypothetical protein